MKALPRPIQHLSSAVALTFGSALIPSVALSQGANVCANADVIATVPSTTPFDTNNPSDTPGTPATTTSTSGCGTSSEVWFSFTPGVSGAYQIDTCGGTFDTELTVFSGTCGALVEEACNDDFCVTSSGVLVGLDAGTQYFISVGFWDVATSAWGSGNINIVERSFPDASGSLADWGAAVAAGTPASYQNTSIPGPIVADVGTRSPAGGLTYEMIVHGTNEGISSCLLGALGTGVGSSAGFKFEQYADTGEYGVTDFGIADHLFPAGDNQENQDLHLAFVVDTVNTSTELFVNGFSFGTAPSAPVLEGLQGIGKIYRPTGAVLDTFFGAIRGLVIYDSMLSASELLSHSDAYFNSDLGTSYCGPAVPNATGASTEIGASGSLRIADNNLTLRAENLPNATFCFFLVSLAQGNVPGPGGSVGTLCLGGSIGRYVGPGEIQNSMGQGEVSLTIDLTRIPQPQGFVGALPGQTWFFQAWHRDTSMGQATSNFSDGLELSFQ